LQVVSQPALQIIAETLHVIGYKLVVDNIELDCFDFAAQHRVGIQPGNKLRHGIIEPVPELMGRIGINFLNKGIYSPGDLFTRPPGKLVPVGDEVTQKRILFGTHVVDGVGQSGLHFGGRQPGGKAVQYVVKNDLVAIVLSECSENRPGGRREIEIFQPVAQSRSKQLLDTFVIDKIQGIGN